MGDSIKKKYSLNISGVLTYDEDIQDFMVSVEDKGEFRLSELLEDFDGKQCKISVNYDEDYDIVIDGDADETI